MTRTISVRLDEESEAALRLLLDKGVGQSEAIRRALVSLASQGYRNLVEAEAAAVAADPDDRREIAAIMGELDEISDPW